MRLFEGNLFDARELQDAGIVHENVDPAGTFHDAANRGGHRRGVVDIQRDELQIQVRLFRGLPEPAAGSIWRTHGGVDRVA